jgi:hypothetical protein
VFTPGNADGFPRMGWLFNDMRPIAAHNGKVREGDASLACALHQGEVQDASLRITHREALSLLDPGASPGGPTTRRFFLITTETNCPA